MTKGLVYTTFALLASSLLLLLVMVPVSTNVENSPARVERIGEASFFHDSIMSDMDRALRMGARRSLIAANNYVINSSESLSDPEKNLSDILEKGSVDGTELDTMENVSLNAWTDDVSGIASDSGYTLETELRHSSFNSTDLNVSSSLEVFTRLKDPSTGAAFNKTNAANETVSAVGVEDTMLLLRSKGKYVANYEDCSFEDPARELYTTTTHSSGAVYGEAVVNPSDASSVSDSGEKVIVATNISDYSVSDVESFKAAVSGELNSTDPSGIEYAFETGDGTVADIGDNMSLILKNGHVWRSGFREMFHENCYVETGRGPSVIDRFANRMVSPDSSGVATLVNVPELPDELEETDSSVGYVYFNDSGDYGPLHEIDGVTGNYSWFRLDDHHVDEWDVNQLTG